MATKKGAPRGSFDFLLAMDCETTGLCTNHETPVFNDKERHQTVSWGFIVANVETLRPIEKLYVEIKWNDVSKAQRETNPEFGKKAESIHGLTYDYLEKNGIPEEEAVLQVGNLIIKHWGNTNIRTLGHNVHSFDLPFFRDIMSRHGVNLPFGNRHYDSNSVGFSTFGTFNSDDLFEKIGFPHREAHNALTDAEQALEVFRVVRTLWRSQVLPLME